MAVHEGSISAADRSLSRRDRLVPTSAPASFAAGAFQRVVRVRHAALAGSSASARPASEQALGVAARGVAARGQVAARNCRPARLVARCCDVPAWARCARCASLRRVGSVQRRPAWGGRRAAGDRPAWRAEPAVPAEGRARSGGYRFHWHGRSRSGPVAARLATPASACAWIVHRVRATHRNRGDAQSVRTAVRPGVTRPYCLDASSATCLPQHPERAQADVPV